MTGRHYAISMAEERQGLAFRERFRTALDVIANGGVITGGFGAGMKVEYPYNVSRGNYIAITVWLKQLPTGIGASGTRFVDFGDGAGDQYYVYVASTTSFAIRNTGDTLQSFDKGGTDLADNDIVNILIDLSAGTMKARVYGYSWSATVAAVRADLVDFIVNYSANAETLFDRLEVWQSDVEFTDTKFDAINSNQVLAGTHPIVKKFGRSNVFEYNFFKPGSTCLYDQFENMPNLYDLNGNLDIAGHTNGVAFDDKNIGEQGLQVDYANIPARFRVGDDDFVCWGGHVPNENTGYYNRIIGQKISYTGEGFELMASMVNYSFIIEDTLGVNATINGSGVYSTTRIGLPVFLLAAKQGSFIHLYINGQKETPVDSSAVGSLANNGDLTLGWRKSLNSMNGVHYGAGMAVVDLTESELDAIAIQMYYRWLNQFLTRRQ